MAEDSGFVFEGTPENIDVEQEVNDKVGTDSFDAFKLAGILVEIGERMTGVYLYTYQKEPLFRIIYSLLKRDGAEITILYPRQSGKSEVVAVATNIIAIIFPVLAKIFPKELSHFGRGAKMGLLAPQGEQVDTVYLRCMERLNSKPVRKFMEDPDIDDELIAKAKFKLKSGSTLTGQSAAKQSKVESKTYHIVFLDESQDMDTDKVRRSIIPMTASTFGSIIRTGTPGRYKGDFYHTIQNNKKHDAKLRTKKDRMTKQLHFEYNYKHVVKCKNEQYAKDGLEFHTLYERAVKRDMESWGDKSEAFRMAYRVEWLLEIGMFLTENDFEEYMMDRKRAIRGSHAIKKEDFMVAGLDIASARNETVLTYGRIPEPAIDFGEHPVKEVDGWVVLKNTNYQEQFEILVRELLEKNIRVLYADYTGVGRALTDMLIHYLGDVIEIIPYVFTPSSKSDMWKAWDEDIRNNLFKIPASKKAQNTEEFKTFKEQITNLQKFWRGSYLVCEKTQGFSDDYCDSGALFNLAGNHLYVPIEEMQVDKNVLINTSDNFDLRRNSEW